MVPAETPGVWAREDSRRSAHHHRVPPVRNTFLFCFLSSGSSFFCPLCPQLSRPASRCWTLTHCLSPVLQAEKRSNEGGFRDEIRGSSRRWWKINYISKKASFRLLHLKWHLLVFLQVRPGMTSSGSWHQPLSDSSCCQPSTPVQWVGFCGVFAPQHAVWLL